ncbi:MAG: helix-turn-helix domain-containing protein [Ruminococcus sp.]|nr:helix-turn-helix domain-containing protein [Ruminococcus sp.]
MLNKKATAVYDYIRRQSECGIPPTVREICAALEIRSTSTVHRYVQLLVDEGYLEKYGKQNRALRLTGVKGTRVPLLISLCPEEGTLTDVQNIRRYVSVDTEDSSRLFAWELGAEDQMPCGFSVGDIIIVEKTETIGTDAVGLYAAENRACVGTASGNAVLLGRLAAMIRRF